ncbi:molybdopterin-dependent oxidoreductase [Methylobacterium sp. WL30]|uniref:molybdopterin-dependent oxidoreductase n=1 Tax=unclassified Methylobacterium TaxID=2615210 RepID=UPI0011CBD095|nr:MULTISPECIES: molybdopterin-dependent oxidoreductase [unclassified Methylobacterium]TXM92296.1 molybdopterin-dependent oxidoreductase [Methylobacterium sp. WL116]TXN33190.1 molybdopterin-dependent oxidoreductase [Methylobacterium sp. WL93]TXN48330.1 molybdopterin-dependent oxidoreductase [Methylobacterium sp. WL119]TXN65186.1 molybdopterin-dependent oxidoreductase [Methylobacterium sp. WL30]
MSSLAERKARLIVHGDRPYNAEPPLARLRAAYRTPAEDFYVRSHGDLPDLDPDTWRLAVEGGDGAARALSLHDLRTRFPQVTVTATLQCAGNRRADMRAVAPVSGDPWDAGAIGTAAWTGVRLGDLLRAAGVTEGADLHVAFESHDRVDGRPYGASIPLAKAMAPETLLAYAMNGEALLPEHGFPVRAVVPGFAGVRSPKWLRRLAVQDRPSDNPIQAEDYKLYPPDVGAETADPARGHTIDTMPLNAAICEPERGAALRAGRTRVRGYAVSGDRAIVRVDVSGNGGRSWRQANLEHAAGAPFAWTFWAVELDLPPGEHELAVRAWDAAGQTQPALPDDTWNHKGYLCACWHRVRVSVTAARIDGAIPAAHD